MKYKKEKDWEEIDKIADENGGHYVVPTYPGIIDTSAVSEFIREHRVTYQYLRRLVYLAEKLGYKKITKEERTELIETCEKLIEEAQKE
jgi:hypothetical protein